MTGVDMHRRWLDPAGIGFGLLWALQLTFLFANVLSVESGYRGADLFNYLVSVGVIIPGLLMFALGRYHPATDELAGRRLGIFSTVCFVAATVVIFFRASTMTIVADCLSGFLVGCGLVVGYATWFVTFSSFPKDRIRASLIYAAIVGLVAHTVMMYLPSLPRLATILVLALLSALCLRFATIDERSYGGMPSDGDPSTGKPIFFRKDGTGVGQKGMRPWSNLKTSPVESTVATVLLTGITGFIYGIAAMVFLNMVGEFVPAPYMILNGLVARACAVAVFCILLSLLHEKLSLAAAYRVAFPLAVAGFLLLPFLGEAYGFVLDFFVAVFYQYVELILFYVLATRPPAGQRLALSGIAFAIFWTGVNSGLLLGTWLTGATVEQFVRLTAIGMIATYFLAMGLFFLLKDRDTQNKRDDSLRDAIEEVSDFQTVCNDVGRKYNLSKREAQMFSYLVRGRSSTYICDELYLSRNTVKSYIKSLYAKLDIHSKQELLDFFEREIELLAH